MNIDIKKLEPIDIEKEFLGTYSEREYNFINHINEIKETLNKIIDAVDCLNHTVQDLDSFVYLLKQEGNEGYMPFGW